MIAFVHGVPETAAIWRKVRAAIDRESTALALPGFSCARPDGFDAAKDDYVDWLRAELGRIDEPIDLVGHDWGAGFTYRVATAHGDLVRSWVADIGNIAHPTTSGTTSPSSGRRQATGRRSSRARTPCPLRPGTSGHIRRPRPVRRCCSRSARRSTDHVGRERPRALA